MAAKKESKITQARNVAGKKRSDAYKEMQKIMEVGKEPKYSGSTEKPEYRKFLMQYYNWANLMFEPVDLKSHFVEYCKTVNYEHNELSGIPPYYFNKLGKIAYLINTDAPVSAGLMDSFDTSLFEFINTWHEYEEKTQKPSYSDDEDNEKMDAKTKNMFRYMNFYNDIDKTLGAEDCKERVLKIVTDAKPPLNILQMLYTHYKEDDEEYTRDLEQKRLPKKYKETALKYKTFTENVLEVINTQMTVAKNVKASTRKPRKKKVIPHTKLVEKMSYLKQDDSIGMVSISPEGIIGAKTLIIFNTKTRKFGIFYAKDEDGLSVKGTTIINFDEDKSKCKTLRKPKEQLSELISGNKKKTEKAFGDIKSVETSLKGRINDSVLLLKTFR